MVKRTFAWHINADEPKALDYNQEFKSVSQIENFYDVNPYRSSDHDPVIVSLFLAAENTPPSASFELVQTGAVVTVTDSSFDHESDTLSYLWDFGDGTNVQAKNYQHEYTQSGEYTVSLTVTDGGGLSHSVSQVISIQFDNEAIAPVALINSMHFWLFDVFISESYDLDGEIVKQTWKFNDGFRVGGPVAIRFASRADRVKLIVKDNDKLTGKVNLRY